MRQFGNIDRRILYVLLAVVLVGPLVKPIGLPISIGDYTEKSIFEIESYHLRIQSSWISVMAQVQSRTRVAGCFDCEASNKKGGANYRNFF